MAEIFYTAEQVRGMKAELAQLYSNLSLLEEDDSTPDWKIEALRNKINGLEYSISGEN
jgi:hypothetical protein